MLKTTLFSWVFPVIGCLLLAACAGNPPQWWNPSGMYNPSAAQPPATSTVHPSDHAATTEPSAEDSFVPSIEEYEELKITPLATEPEELEVSEAAAQAVAQENALPLADPSILE